MSPMHSTPTAIRVATGNPSQRPLPQGEPQATRGEPTMPTFLSARAQQVWIETVPVLLQLGTLTTADGDALTAYCETYVTWRMAQESIDKDGIIIDSPQGKRKNPAVNVADSSLKQLRSLMGEFGLTPASRTRIKSNNPEAQSVFSRLLGERAALITNGSGSA
jgi:P27 family predicted phage terminase small subunit